MNSRMVLAISAFLLFIVSELVGEGDPIASLAVPKGEARQTSAPATLAKASPAATGSSNDFFANYEPPESEQRSLILDRPHSSASLASLGGTASGALTQQQLLDLGLEMPSPGGVKQYEFNAS